MEFTVQIETSSAASNELAKGSRPSASDYAITRHRVVVNGVDIGTVAELPGGALRARLEIRSIICNAVLPIFGPGIV